MNIQDRSASAIFGKVVVYIVLIIFTFLAIYPIAWLVMSSFKTSQEFMLNKLGLPGTTEGFSPTLINYKDAWVRGNFGTLILNSIFYTGISVFFVILFSFMAGFAFAKLNSKATPILHGSFVIGLLMTLQCIMVPLFLMSSWFHLLDTRLGVLIPYIGIGMPMGVYLATEYIKSIPNALIESARLDGAKFYRIFAQIVLPMSLPVAVTLAILTVTGTWNEFMLINILTSSAKLKSLPVGIQAFAGSLSSDYGKQFAALVIGLIPMLGFYLAFNKEITKGVAAGAVKG